MTKTLSDAINDIREMVRSSTAGVKGTHGWKS